MRGPKNTEVARPTSRPRCCLALGTLLLGTASCTTERGLVLGYSTDLDAAAPATRDASAPRLDAGSSLSSTDSGVTADAGWPGAPFADACRPEVSYQNLDTTEKGQLFDQAIADPVALVQEISATVCSFLYASPDSVKSVPSISLTVEDYDGIAETSGMTLRLSSNYIDQVSTSGGDVPHEIRGVLHFAISTMYQYTGEGTAPTWVVTGIADFVRLRAGYFTAQDRPQGGTWTDGFRTTAFFLDWLTEATPDLVVELNARLVTADPGFDETLFQELAGQPLDTLWADYQATL